MATTPASAEIPAASTAGAAQGASGRAPLPPEKGVRRVR